MLDSSYCEEWVTGVFHFLHSDRSPSSWLREVIYESVLWPLSKPFLSRCSVQGAGCAGRHRVTCLCLGECVLWCGEEEAHCANKRRLNQAVMCDINIARTVIMVGEDNFKSEKISLRQDIQADVKGFVDVTQKCTKSSSNRWHYISFLGGT